MSRDLHCKSSPSKSSPSKSPPRLGWAALAVFLVACPGGASAQGLFSLFAGPSSYDIERRLEASGYILNGPLVLRGDVYLADVVGRGEGPERLIIDPQSGRIMQRFRAHGDRWREEAAAPPGAYGDDPRQWNGPRPPADIGPGAPPDAWVPAAPDVVETPRAEPRKVEIKPKPKSTPVANVVNPPVVPAAPTATAKPSPALVKPAAPSTPAAAASPRPMATPSVQAAKADAPSLAVKPAAPAPSAPAGAKTKAVNDIPVTPPD